MKISPNLNLTLLQNYVINLALKPFLSNKNFQFVFTMEHVFNVFCTYWRCMSFKELFTNSMGKREPMKVFVNFVANSMGK